ncbi:MAG: 4-alpha-glucanotransferase [Alphaproteobacteria bacterium]
MTGARDTSTLARLASAYGVQRSYLSDRGRIRRVSDAVVREVLEAMGVAARTKADIERALAQAPSPQPDRMVAPAGLKCFLPDWLERDRAWGITCQLYGLRSARNHGIGDFEDLARLAEIAAQDGADFVGVNPLHALFSADPDRCSPFSPSSRRFLNPLYIAIDRVPGLSTPPDFRPEVVSSLRAGQSVDYRAVADFKFRVLRRAWPNFKNENSVSDFNAFVREGSEMLWAHACFEALSHHMADQGKGAGWHRWPGPFQAADSAAVTAFAQDHEADIRFHLWLQWIADTQLAEAMRRAGDAGMRIGLYLDFAVGTAPDGSATWSRPDLVVRDAHIGSPPDAFFQAGQDWGLAPMSPRVLRQEDMMPYRTLIGRATCHAGALRIDHAMNIYRLYWIPEGRTPDEGAYVLYPLAGMLEVLADVSAASRTLLVGEDLGTVPKGFSDILRRAHILSSEILYFARDRKGFHPAGSYVQQGFASVSTHDLPPLLAWWGEEDIHLLRSIGQIDNAESVRRRGERRRDREALVRRLTEEGICSQLSGDGFSTLGPQQAADIHRFLARTPAYLLGVQVDDLCGETAPVNVPGTHDEYPNWRRRLPLDIEDLGRSPFYQAIVAAVRAERPPRQ